MKYVGEEKHMKNYTPEQTGSSRKKKVFISAILTLTFLLALHVYLSTNEASLPLSPSVAKDAGEEKKVQQQQQQCDLYSGKWIPYPRKPYYTHDTCPWISPQHDCIKFGRPDTDFIHWKWKPDRCDLPRFNAAQFLELVRGKSMAFVGDSVAKNQMSSLVCLLGKVTYPVDVSDKYSVNTDYFKRWYYADYKFMAAALWSPFLVRAEDGGPNNIKKLYLDEADKGWAEEIAKFDYVIISAGQWFFRPFMYYQQNQLVGCYACQQSNVTEMSMFHGYKMAFRTSFEAIVSLDKFKGTTFLRTFSPAHFENGLWNTGGSCGRTKPYESGEVSLEGESLELYLTQIEEFKKAEKNLMKDIRGLRFRLMDTTSAMVMRPDGHPNRYGFSPHGTNKSIADCVHWCLPGPVDTWNEFLLQMLKINNLADS
ncbi:unnamed protein product [Rhodiola kirilowii]